MNVPMWILRVKVCKTMFNTPNKPFTKAQKKNLNLALKKYLEKMPKYLRKINGL